MFSIHIIYALHLVIVSFSLIMWNSFSLLHSWAILVTCKIAFDLTLSAVPGYVPFWGPGRLWEWGCAFLRTWQQEPTWGQSVPLSVTLIFLWEAARLAWAPWVHAQSCSTLCNCRDCRLICPWDFPDKNTGVGCHFLYGIFAAQGLNPRLLHLVHWQTDSLPLSRLGSPAARHVVS